MSNDRVKHSHIIPHFYLKNFIFDDIVHPQNKESVLVAYKDNFNKWKQKGIGQKSIFTSNGIYDFLSISESEQTVEKYLGVIETKMGIALQKLGNHSIISLEDYICLARFIISLLNRVPTQMKRLQSLIDRIRESFEEFDTLDDKEFMKSYFYGYEDASKIRILGTDKIINDSKFLQDSFYFLYNETNIPFITSDNPVVIEDMSKHEIEGILTFPVNDEWKIDRKCIILPLTPSITVFYCDYLDKIQVNSQYISVLDENIVFKLNILQLRNCEKLVISNMDNSGIDYDRCYKDLSNIDYSDKLIFCSKNNKYVLRASFIEHEVFHTKIKIYDVDKYNEIIVKDIFTEVYTCNYSDYTKITSIKTISRNKDYLIIETSFLNKEIEKE